MNLCEAVLTWIVALTLCKCDGEQLRVDPELAAQQYYLQCKYVNETDAYTEAFLETDLLYPSNYDLAQLRKISRVCLPPPCEKLRAYSGYIPVDDDKSSYLFFLHIKSEDDMKKPLLLWLQGGPGKSSLFGQFLENGPLGIDASGNLYYRKHTLLNYFNIIYLDQPVGSGYSFDKGGKYPKSLEEASCHVIKFLRRFLQIFHEYTERDLYIAGESYGARSTVGVAYKLMKEKPEELSLHIKGMMLGAGFLFPLLDIINSTDFLYYTTLLDDCSRNKFSDRFNKINELVEAGDYLNASMLLSMTVLNLRSQGQKSLFEILTGFTHHGSIVVPQRPKETYAYYRYANSTKFKRIIHVSPTKVLDGTRYQISVQLAVNDFFKDHQEQFVHVLNRARVLFYTAQLDAVFPAINIEESFKKLQWRGNKTFLETRRELWHHKKNSSLELLGYVKHVGAVMYTNVLLAGHYVSLDRSNAVSELYANFLEFTKKPPPTATPSR